MKVQKAYLALLILVPALSSNGFAANHDLQYFLAKASSKETVLSTTEKRELLEQIEGILEKAQKIQGKLTQSIQSGEIDIRYQEGRFWMSQLEEDRASIETAIQQIKLLREKPALLVPSVRLYKSLKDLSGNFNACNNLPSFSALVGDLAPEMQLWADPVFYELYVLPLVRVKDGETEAKPVQKEKEKTPGPKEKTPPPPKGKKP